jgi:hypothetical protein
VLALPIAAALLLVRIVTTYEQGWITVTVCVLVDVAAAWLARLIALRLDSWQAVRTLRKSNG